MEEVRSCKEYMIKGNYAEIDKLFRAKEMVAPNSQLVASILYTSQEPKSLLENKRILEFTASYYLPKSNKDVSNGVILEHNPKIKNGKLEINKEDLIKRLMQNDSSVRFVPFGYKTGELTRKEIAENPYINARYGEQGAGQIAEISSKYSGHAYLWSFSHVDEEKAVMSAILNNRGFGDRLIIDGKWWMDTEGYCFDFRDE